MLAGMGFGAAEALAAERERKLREFQVKEQARIAQEEMTRRVAEDAAQRDLQLKQLDLADLRRRDENNARGIDLMRADKQQMDTDAAISSLPPHLKPLEGLIRIGMVPKLAPEDMEDPNTRASRAAAAREQAVQDQIRVRRESRAPTQPRERKQVWIKRGDQVLPIEEGTAQPGDAPYDPVAARSSQPSNPAEAQDTAREAKRLATALLNHKGLNGAFGLADAYLPTLRQSTADAESLRDGLTSLLTLENTGKLKGVLSNTDMQILRQASSTLNPRMSEAAARAELKRIIDVMGRAAGEGGEAGGAGDAIDALIKKYGGGQ